MKLSHWIDKPFIGVKKESWDALYHGIYLENKKPLYIRITKEQAQQILKELTLIS